MQASACAPRLARSALGSPSYILSARGRVMCTGRSNMRGRCRACSAASLRPSRPSHRYPRLPATLPHRRTRVRALPRPGAVTPADAPHRRPRHGKQPRLAGTASSATARSCTCAQSPSSESPATCPRGAFPAAHSPPRARPARHTRPCPVPAGTETGTKRRTRRGRVHGGEGGCRAAQSATAFGRPLRSLGHRSTPGSEPVGPSAREDALNRVCVGPRGNLNRCMFGNRIPNFRIPLDLLPFPARSSRALPPPRGGRESPCATASARENCIRRKLAFCSITTAICSCGGRGAQRFHAGPNRPGAKPQNYIPRG